MADQNEDEFLSQLKHLTMERSDPARIEVSRTSLGVLRMMLSGIFLIAGINHVIFPAHVAKRLVASPVYQNLMSFMNAEVLVVATGVGLLLGGLLLFSNRYTRMAAIILLMLLVPITVSVQLEGWNTAGPLFKNVAIAGGLLFFILNDFESVKRKNYETQS